MRVREEVGVELTGDDGGDGREVEGGGGDVFGGGFGAEAGGAGGAGEVLDRMEHIGG